MVQDRGAGTPMGMCGLIRREALPEVDLGYAFVPEFWGRGHAREAAAACLAYAREVLRLPGVLAIVSPGNASSIRLLEALTFRSTGSMEWSPGDEVVVYRLALD
jgi:RimJ/RimL family protein N-acetyltransferase